MPQFGHLINGISLILLLHSGHLEKVYIFWSKNKALYDRDPAVGPWPITRAEMAEVNLRYPCKVSKLTVAF